MGGEEDGGLVFFAYGLQIFPEVLAALGVEAGGGFVEKEDFGLMHERADDFQFALHAAGVGFDGLVQFCLDP